MSTALSPGARLGPYEIVAAIGAGGMGEVLRARDTKLGREVAIKVLPPAFAQDAERVARFRREAQILASLNHPNIAAIHDFDRLPVAADGSRPRTGSVGERAPGSESRATEEEPGPAGAQGARPASVFALVMELVEGEDLAQRLKRGAIPVDEAIEIAKQIAEALEEAHEKGIVHRDLKPANIKVTADGKVKVLDFGLAKAFAGDPMASSGAHDLSQSPTLAGAGTQAGVILGTAAYMSPEQARGKPVDKRADIWAFGVVLFEMLNGKGLFGGETVSDVLAAVLTRDISLATLPAQTPGAVRRLLRRCLERDPKRRLRDIGEARLALIDADDEPEAHATTPEVAAPRSFARRAGPWVAGFVLGAAAVGALERTLLKVPPPEPPRLVSLTYSGSDSLPTVSPDGRTVAFRSLRDGRSRIWLKQLATGEEVALTAGPNDFASRFSPDGSTLLFLRGATPPYGLFQVAAVGGEARRITDGIATAADWAPDGQRIALTRASTAGGVADTLVVVGRDGASPKELARVTDVLLASLRWSPDGATIGALTYTPANTIAHAIAGFDATSGARRSLYVSRPGVQLGAWSWSGTQALLVTEAANLSGRGGSVLRRVNLRDTTPSTLISLQQPSVELDVAGPGRLVLDVIAPTQSLFRSPLAARTGAAVPLLPTRGESIDRQPVFSPDRSRVLFTSDRGGNVDLWELELASGGVRRLTVAEADDWDPAYSPDGQQLIWSSNRTGHFEIWAAARDGSGARQVSSDGVDAQNPTMTPDGRWIVYASANPARRGIWKIRPDGTEGQSLVEGSMNNAELSPDGRWVSFIDTETSRLRVVTTAEGSEVAVLDLPAVSTSRNSLTTIAIGRSRWVGQTTTLAWVDYDSPTGTSRLVAQEIAAGRDTRATRRTLFSGSLESMPESFGISPDGRELLISTIRNRSDLLLVEGLPGVIR